MSVQDAAPRTAEGAPALPPRARSGGDASSSSSSSSSTAAAAAAAAASAARKIGPLDFLWGTELGLGAYARVVHARLKRASGKVGKEYAVKVMEKRFIRREGKTAFVMQERNILSRARHPYILRVVYTFQDAEHLYFVLDLCKGGDLQRLIRHHLDVGKARRQEGSSSAWVEAAAAEASPSLPPATLARPAGVRGTRPTILPVPVARFILAQVLLGLQYLHTTLRVVHR